MDSIVKEDILRSIAVAVDSAALNGAGAANSQPVGILTVGSNVAGGPYNNNLRAPSVTFGAAATYDSVMRFWVMSKMLTSTSTTVLAHS